jgi:hypothetical protein
VLAPESVAFGLPTARGLREPINRALLRIVEEDRWLDIQHEYLGYSSAAPGYGGAVATSGDCRSRHDRPRRTAAL